MTGSKPLDMGVLERYTPTYRRPRGDSNAQPTDSKDYLVDSIPYIWCTFVYNVHHMGVKIDKFFYEFHHFYVNCTKLHQK